MKQYKEIPELKQIVENRGIGGKFKVYLSFSLIWGELMRTYWRLILSIIIPLTGVELDRQVQFQLPKLLAFPTTIAIMHLRMKKQAEERWQWKYGSREIEKADDSRKTDFI